MENLNAYHISKCGLVWPYLTPIIAKLANFSNINIKRLELIRNLEPIICHYRPYSVSDNHVR